MMLSRLPRRLGFPVMICYPDLFVGCVENGDDAL